MGRYQHHHRNHRLGGCDVSKRKYPYTPDGGASHPRGSSYGTKGALRTDSRGIAIQLDFLNAMILLIGGIVGLLFLSNAFIAGMAQGGSGQDTVAIRGSERLADDIFLNETSDALLTPGCTEDFFAQGGNSTCGYTDFSDDSELDYLRNAMGIREPYEINVTIEDTTGVWEGHAGSGSPYKHRLGPSTPSIPEISTIHRQVSYGDYDGDGEVEYFTMYVRVWR